ncbi:unnamed protein product [Blepharisma stoltei]|uniref:Phosphoglycerate mutase n=1 Tax=Blepharisma stoltei TaxID=1481888 RepID=A0AAU9K7W8_9CILI|nr:unnamed protein product [Blepharisma stoltei]
MELFLTRHGETVGNVDRIIQGQHGGELTQLGFEQALLLGERLNNYRFDAIYSSDLHRCQQTLSQIIQYHNYIQPVLDPRIREKSGGEMEGMPLGSTDRAARALGINPREFKPPGGECWRDVHRRAKDFLNHLLRNHLETNDSPNPQKILIISHGGWIMEFLNAIRELKGQEAVLANKSHNTALYIIRFSRKGNKLTYKMMLENDTSHLKPKNK